MRVPLNISSRRCEDKLWSLVFQKLKKATGKDEALERRQKMQCHQKALDTSVALIQSAQKPKKTLPFKNFHAKAGDV